MKKFINILFTILLLFFIGYLYQNVSSRDFNLAWKNFKNIFFPLVPCAQPISYKIGTFDEHFNITQDYFLDAMKEAEAVWEKPYGKELFTFKPNDTSNILKVNLVFDYRQEATSKLADIGITVKDTQASYDSLKSKFESLKAEYINKEKNFQISLSVFNTDKKNYEDLVAYWNKKGGAPQKEYDSIQNMRLALENKSKELQNTQNIFNNMVSEINSMVVVLNRMASNLNINVAKYNTIGASRGESFEEGVYRRDNNGEEIDIYEFSNRAKLVRVLAHELGHALGIEHVKDPKAIMYELNQGNTQSPIEADLNALRVICNSKI